MCECHLSVSCQLLFFYLFSLGSLYIFANIKLPSDESRASDINLGELLVLSAFLLSPLPLLCYPLLWWGGFLSIQNNQAWKQVFQRRTDTISSSPVLLFFMSQRLDLMCMMLCTFLPTKGGSCIYL